MQDINKYISGLLFIHDCVILPGFGGFITNDKSALHNETNHTFHPPKKDILFNKNLTYNDGLLINYLAKNLNISYEQAKENVKQEVERAWLKLDRQELVEFNGVGTFRLDNDQKLIFTPDETENYQIDSYGLSSFRFPPLSYEKNAREIIPLYNQSNMNEGVKKVLKWAGIIILPIIGAIALAPITKSKFNQQSAGFVKSKTNVDKPIELTHTAMPTDSASDNIIDKKTDKRVALFYAEENKSSVKKQKTDGMHFYIIGGSYKNIVNANQQADFYKSKGFLKTSVIHVDELYRVSLSKHENKLNAMHELRRIRNEENNDKVWLYTEKNSR